MPIDEPVHLSSYDSHWPRWFEADAIQIRAALSEQCRAIEHFGSTSVPNMLAKPVIDILVAPASWPPTPSTLKALISLGYQHLGDAGVPGRQYFRRRSPHATNLALVEWNGTLWRHNLAIRDLLRSTPSLANRYAETKKRAWTQGARTLLAYSDAKSTFMTELLSAALERQRENDAG